MGVEKAAGVSTAAVKKATGRDWDEWFALLDADEAHRLSHPEIATLLSRKHGAPDWWSQMITVGFEQERGLRDKHQVSDGFAASASKTINVARERLFEAWSDESLRAQWLPNAPLSVRKATAPKSLRISWEGGASVDVELYAKGEAKSQVSVQHTRLVDAEAVAAMKAFWSDALARLKAHLEG